MLKPGQIIKNKYRLMKLIGEGGMGTVWEGFHETIKKKVAIKVLLPRFARGSKGFDRFAKEAQIASAIGHRSIVEIYDMDVLDDNTPFIVMELLEGQSLAAYLKRTRVLDTDETIKIIRPVIQSLEQAHRKGIIHLDLKPENIFLCQSEKGREVKILDFGLSKIETETGPKAPSGSGSAMGTPGYMSPEQVKAAGDLDHRVDIFAIGVICYRCLTGRLPFDGDSYKEIFHAIISKEPDFDDDFSQVNVTGKLIRIVQKALEKDPAERYQSCAEIEEAIVDYQSEIFNTTMELPLAGDGAGEGTRAEQGGEKGRRNRFIWLIAAALVCAAAGAAVIGVSAGKKNEPAAQNLQGTHIKSVESAGTKSPPGHEEKKARVELSFVPGGSRIFYDEAQVPGNPFFITPDGKTHRIKIESDNDGSFSTSITPEPGAENIEVTVNMEKAQEEENSGGEDYENGDKVKDKGAAASKQAKVKKEQSEDTLKKAGHATTIETVFKE